MFPLGSNRGIILIAALVIGWTGPAAAQGDPSAERSAPAANPDTSIDPAIQPSPPPAKPRSFVRTLVHDEYRIWTAPFRPGNYDSHTMKKYGIPFLAISGALIASDRKTADLLPNTPDQARWSGRISQLGAGYTLAGFAGGTFLLGSARGDNHMREAGLLALEAVAHSQAVVFGLKQITQRERPLASDQRGGFWKGGDSFPSGHATTSFAVASVFAYEYRDHLAVPITAYSLATLITASRMSAQRHWLSDLFVGGSLGFLLGRYVYKQHHDPNLPGSPVERRSQLVPKLGFGAGTVNLDWNF